MHKFVMEWYFKVDDKFTTTARFFSGIVEHPSHYQTVAQISM